MLICELAERAFVLAEWISEADEIAVDDFVEPFHALNVQLCPACMRGFIVIREPAVRGFVGVGVDLGAGCEDLQALGIVERVVGRVEHDV